MSRCCVISKFPPAVVMLWRNAALRCRMDTAASSGSCRCPSKRGLIARGGSWLHRVHQAVWAELCGSLFRGVVSQHDALQVPTHSLLPPWLMHDGFEGSKHTEGWNPLIEQFTMGCLPLIKQPTNRTTLMYLGVFLHVCTARSARPFVWKWLADVWR